MTLSLCRCPQPSLPILSPAVLAPLPTQATASRTFILPPLSPYALPLVSPSSSPSALSHLALPLLSALSLPSSCCALAVGCEVT